ncbi:MAG: formamidopyrimidine-DNA glycosylase [Candidatus Parcubacteria bacterium]|jgi:formamidopyrimidine-DNA glycosylase
MPELPEVETVRLQLKHKVIGRTIVSVEIFHPKTVGHSRTVSKKLSGKTITEIDRVGKLLIFSFKDEDNLFLLAHLKMTGQFFFVDKKGAVIGGGHSMTAADKVLPGRHTRVAFHFTDGTTLYFNDMRLFGYTKLADAKEVAEARTGFGPEPIDPDFDSEWFQKILRTRKTSVKAALLNQSFVAGLGNIYVDESLWRAKVKPMRLANTLTKKEALEIARHAGEVMNESITVGGTTFQHFEDTDGNKGNFTNHLQVFGKQKTPCPRCSAIIIKTKTAGRGTHYCPKCQK